MAKYNAVPKMTASDREWQAKDDARTLSAAQEILADKKRLSAAAKAAKALAVEKTAEAKAMQKVAKKKV